MSANQCQEFTNNILNPTSVMFLTYSTVSSQLHHCCWSRISMSSLNLTRQNSSMAFP